MDKNRKLEKTDLAERKKKNKRREKVSCEKKEVILICAAVVGAHSQQFSRRRREKLNGVGEGGMAKQGKTLDQIWPDLEAAMNTLLTRLIDGVSADSWMSHYTYVLERRK